MTSEDRKMPADVPWRNQGTGMYNTFLCPLCAKFKGMDGRKIRLVQGLRQYVCKGCAK